MVSVCLWIQGEIEGPCQGRDCSVCQCLPAKGARVWIIFLLLMYWQVILNYSHNSKVDTLNCS